MNFKFSRGYGEYQAVQSIGMCCYSNINSAELLLLQQWGTALSIGDGPDDAEGL
jgi:hypothetical protein